MKRTLCEYVDDHGTACTVETNHATYCGRHTALLSEWKFLMRQWCESISWNGMDHPRTQSYDKQSKPLAKQLGITGC